MHFPHLKRVLIALIVLSIPLVLVGGASGSAVSTVPLGTAGSFAVLAATAITDVPTSSLTGAVGLSPTTGAANGVPCAEVTGRVYSVDAFGPAPCSQNNPGLLTIATNDETTAFNNAAGRSPDTTFAPGTDNPLGGKTLLPGVYKFGGAPTANLIGNVTLKGDADSVWIFQATSTLVTAGSSSVTLAGGAQACHVFWEVGSSATLGATSTFKGTILASASITLGNGVNVSGRLLAQAAVSLDADSISRPACSSASGGGSTPSREIYCDPVTGQTYDLIAGQDKEPPYDKLNLVPATVDPVTGAKSCSVSVVAATTTTTTTTTATTTTATTTTTTTPTPVKPAPKPGKKHGTAAVRKSTSKSSTTTKSAPKHHAVRIARHVAPRRPLHPFGVTG